MKLFRYKTAIGTFYIQKHQQKENHFSLCFEEVILHTYKSAEHAAEDVFFQSTGYVEWDNFNGLKFELPEDLSWWETISTA